jgi:SAM-dependent methyltransferase
VSPDLNDLYSSPKTENRPWLEIGVGIITGLAAALGLSDHLNRPSTWVIVVGVALLGFLGSVWIKTSLFSAPPIRTLESNEASQLADSILKSQHANYALSSNWIDLWRTDAFRYYLALDQVSSLAIYTRMNQSPLKNISADPSQITEYFDLCRSLMKQVADGVPPIAQHRMRVLIYPRAVYTEYGNRIVHLLRLHAVGRVVCVPLIAEEIEQALNRAERDAITNLTVNQLGQTYEDKLPPQPFYRRGALKRLVKSPSEVVFPDLLLIDPTKSVKQLWWYNKTTVRHLDRGNGTVVDNAYHVLRTVCAKGQNAIWTDFSPDYINKIPVVDESRKSTGAELFFSLGYYEEWLNYIQRHATDDPAAGALSRWQQGELLSLTREVSRELQGLAPGAHLRVIDVGCGGGRHLLKLAEEFPNLCGLGIDIIPAMVGLAAHDARVKQMEDRLYFCLDDATSLSSARPAEFDLAICMTNTLGNLEEAKVAQSLRQIHRVLKPNGRLIVSVYSPNSIDSRLGTYQRVGLHVERLNGKIRAAEGLESSHFSNDRLRTILSERGFVVDSIEDIEGVGWFAVAERQ